MNKLALSEMELQAPRADNREGVSVLSILALLWHGKWTILSSVVVAAVLGGIYAAQMDPVYKSTALIALEPSHQQIADFQSVVAGFSGDEATINTEIGVMRSRRLVGKLVDRLELVEDPEFNAARRQPEESVFDPILQPAVAAVGGPVDMLLVQFGLSNDEAVVSQEPLLTERDRTVSAAERALAVQNEKDSYLFTITALTESPRKSAKLANSLAEIYVLDQVEVKAEAIERATKWLSDRVLTLQAELEQATGALNEFRSETQVVSRESLAALDADLKSLRGRARSLEATLSEQQAQIAAMEEAADSSDPATMAAAAGETGMDRMLRRVRNGEISEAAFEAQFRRALTTLEQNYERTASQLEAIREAAEAKLVEVQEQSKDLIRLRELERNVEASRIIYEHFLQRMKEISVQEGIQEADSRILSYALPSPEPVSPRTGLMIVLSAMIGLLGGSGIVMFRESWHQGVRSGSELEQVTNYNVLAQIPLAPRRRMSFLDYLSKEPASAIAESVRKLRTSLLISNPDHPPQVVLLTSAAPGDGKSTVALTLAQSYASLGTRTLVMDCDFRRHGLSNHFAKQSRPGLVSVLTNQAELEDAIVKAQSGFDVLLGKDLKTTAANAADVFSSERARDLIETLREQYDTIIIDTPPILAVPDAEILGKFADAIVLAVRWNATPMAQVVAVLRLLERHHFKTLGLVLTQVDPRKIHRYDTASYASYASYGGTQTRSGS